MKKLIKSDLPMLSNIDKMFMPFLSRWEELAWPDLNKFFESMPFYHLKTDIYHDKDNYYYRFELPGIKKEDVKIELDNALLTVNASRKTKMEEKEESVSYSRSVSLPEDVDAGNSSAALEDGLLTVTFPKKNKDSSRQITIQ